MHLRQLTPVLIALVVLLAGCSGTQGQLIWRLSWSLDEGFADECYLYSLARLNRKLIHWSECFAGK